jgi:uncharacterized phage protein gp47/JayE
MGLQLKTHEQILQTMINGVVSRTDLSDIVDTSAFKHLLAAFARELDESYFQIGLIPDLFDLDKCVGDDLDRRAAQVQPAAISRRLAAKATGSVIFSRAGTVGTVNIPSGTKMKTSSGIEFVTSAAGAINNTFSASSSVPVIAVVAGAAGNVSLSTIIKFASKPAGVDSVSNPAALTNGRDKESDDELRGRIKDYLATLSKATVLAIEFYAKQVVISSGQRVVFAKVVEDETLRGEVTLYVDDGAGTAETTAAVVGENLCLGLAGPPADSAVGGESRLFADHKPLKAAASVTVSSSTRGALTLSTHYTFNHANGQFDFNPVLTAGEIITVSYTYFTGLIAEVQKVIDGDLNDPSTYPGVRAAGVRVTVLTPQILQLAVAASLTVAEGFVVSDVRAAVQSAISTYINGLGISGDVIRNEIIERIMAVAGVINCTLSTPTTDLVLLDDQLPRITTSNITVT